MACIGSLAQVRQLLAGLDPFGPVLPYLDELLQPDSAALARVKAVPVGITHRVELPGGAFALEQAYQSKPRSEGCFESHRRYIDIQIVIDGEEIMGLVDIARANSTQPWDAQRDLIFYSDTPSASLLQFAPFETAVFFPADVHMPSLCGPGGPALVRKSVVKVPVGSPAA